MRVLVAIKRVVDTTKVRARADRSGVDTGAKRVVINAFCETAVEEGVRLREKGIATDLAVVTVGPPRAQDQLRTALALGADRAIHVQTDIELQPLIVAKLLAAIARQEAPDLVLLGRQAVDTDNTQTGQMLAGLLGWPQATFASRINVDTSKRAVITREANGGTETVSLVLPAVITTDLLLNQPRYPTLPNIILAKKKEMQQLSLKELGVNAEPRVTTTTVEAAPVRSSGTLVPSVAVLADKMRKVLKRHLKN